MFFKKQELSIQLLYIFAKKQKYVLQGWDIYNKLFPKKFFCNWMKYYIDQNNIIVKQYKNNSGIYDIDDIQNI